jgi:hypothetical protein
LYPENKSGLRINRKYTKTEIAPFSQIAKTAFKSRDSVPVPQRNDFGSMSGLPTMREESAPRAVHFSEMGVSRPGGLLPVARHSPTIAQDTAQT